MHFYVRLPVPSFFTFFIHSFKIQNLFAPQILASIIFVCMPIGLALLTELCIANIFLLDSRSFLVTAPVVDFAHISFFFCTLMRNHNV